MKLGPEFSAAFQVLGAKDATLEPLESLDTRVTYDLCSPESMGLELGCNRDLYSEEPLGGAAMGGAWVAGKG